MLLLVDNAVQRSVLSITFACLFLLIDIFHTQSQLKKDREETKTGRKRKRERDTLKRNEIWEKSEKETGEPSVKQLSADAVLLLRWQLVSAEYLIIKQQKRCSEVKRGKRKRCASAEQMLTNYTTRQIEANTRAQRAAKREKGEEVLPYKLIQVTFFPLLALPFL